MKTSVVKMIRMYNKFDAVCFTKKDKCAQYNGIFHVKIKVNQLKDSRIIFILFFISDNFILN